MHLCLNGFLNCAFLNRSAWDMHVYSIHCAVIPPIANSDHNGLLLQWISKLSRNQTIVKPRQIWKYAQGDFERVNNLLSSVNWEQLIDHNDVNESLVTWENYFMNVMESCIPKGILFKRKNIPWLSKNIRWARQKRNNIYRWAKLSECS